MRRTSLLLIATLLLSPFILYIIFQELVMVRGIFILLTDSYGVMLSNADIRVQVEALPLDKQFTTIVYRGRVNGTSIFIDYDLIKDVAESWIKTYPSDEGYETSLFISLWIVRDGDVYSFPLQTVTYNPLKASRGVVLKTLNLDFKSNLCIPREDLKNLRNLGIMQECVVVWDPVPELSWETSSYIEVPILIVNNQYSNSGVINTGIGGYAKYKVTLVLCDNLSAKLYQGIIPDVNPLISGVSRSGYYSYIYSRYVLPNQVYYFYIKARIGHAHYREAIYCGGYPYYTGKEKTEDYVKDIQVSGNDIVGGEKQGFPAYMSKILDGSEEEKCIIPGTVLSDGKLDVDEKIQFNEIFDCYDAYNQDFKMEIPIGIPVGAVLSYYFGIGGAVGSFMNRLTAIIPLGYVGGALKNLGQELNLGYDVYEDIYILTSKYRYATPQGIFKVPVGIYFKCS
jgi:hypothetical protein